jgi:protein-disulfide isomerase
MEKSRMSKGQRIAAQRGEPQEAPAPKGGIDVLSLVTLVGVIALLMISFSNWREIEQIHTQLDSKLGLDSKLARLETQIAQVSTKVDKLPTQAAQPARRGPDPNRVYKIKTAGAPAKGPANAPVVIAEFSDFQCPFCSRVGPTLKRIEEVYQDKVRIVWKNLPLDMHKNAQGAAQAALAADKQGKFWEFHDKLFANQRQLGLESYRKYAADLGLDTAQFDKDFIDPAIQKAIAADKAEARSLEVTGTPGFFVNGRFLKGAKPFEAFAKVIDAELKRQGVPVPAPTTVQ